MENFEQTVIGVVAKAIGVDVSELSTQSGVGDVSKWDSLGHLAVLAAVENHFSLKLSVDETLDCESIEDICEVVRAKVSL
jgi:acyl carrier protein